MRKVVVITGAANGIGLALSQIYLQQGMTLVMVDKDHTKLNHEAALFLAQFPNQVLTVTCDIREPEQVEHLAHYVEQQLGQVDLLYNNAGIIGTISPVWDLKPEEIKTVMEVNLYGMINMIQAFTPLLFKQPFRSHVINMASLYSLCSGSQLAAYSMSKHAVLALSESLYFDLKRLEKPVDVSVIFPSFTDTSLLSHQPSQSSTFHERLGSLLAYGRSPNEVAALIAKEVAQKQFYIMPDKEVKTYCEDRTQAILEQQEPNMNNIEKLMRSLMARTTKIAKGV